MLYDSKGREIKTVTYDRILTIQQAINMAVAEGRTVRFLSKLSNKELRKGIVDKKGCKMLKKDIDSDDVAIIPPCVEGFDFEDIDTSLIITGV